MEIKPDDLVLCTVKKIEQTAVFVEIEGNGEGSIVLSEIAAGRIRNIRDYVSLNKKIVCKVLKASGGHIELSYRRVTAKEKEMVLERSQKEKTFTSMVKAVSKDYLKIISEIQKKYELSEFFEELKENPSLSSKFFPKSESDKLLEILKEKKEKDKEIKKIISIKSVSPSGISEIKEILSTKEAGVSYLGSSRFSIKTKAPDFKEAEKKISEILSIMEKKAKEKKASFEISK